MAVVGGGPAGSAAAILLAREARRVVVLERSAYDADRIGETLPPEVRLPLESLGVWDRFRRDGHSPTPGILAAWGQPDAYANDFILNPYGCGWRLDRARFDEMLILTAEEAGAMVCRETTVHRCDRQPSGRWLLSAAGVGQPPQLMSAAVVVDATGRASPLRRHLGARRVSYDRLVALVCFVAPASADTVNDRRALIEATEHGWWYSAPLPDGRLVLAFHTDAAPGLRASWPDFLSSAPHTAARAAGVRETGVRQLAANSHRREPAAAATWLAVGDAAAAHDPICGLGVYWALESGIAAAKAIMARDRGDADAVPAYDRVARARFDHYLSQRAVYYGAEQRWRTSPFWRRRRKALDPPQG